MDPAIALMQKFIAAVSTVAVGGIATMFAAGDDGGMSSNATAIGALTTGFAAMVALMAWVVKRLLDTTIPGLQATFAVSQDQQRVTFTAALEQQRAAGEATVGRLIATFQVAQDNFQHIVEKILASHKEDLERERNDKKEILIAMQNLTERVDMALPLTPTPKGKP